VADTQVENSIEVLFHTVDERLDRLEATTPFNTLIMPVTNKQQHPHLAPVKARLDGLQRGCRLERNPEIHALTQELTKWSQPLHSVLMPSTHEACAVDVRRMFE